MQKFSCADCHAYKRPQHEPITPLPQDDSARVLCCDRNIFRDPVHNCSSILPHGYKNGKDNVIRSGISAPDQALSYAKADLARALNYAGMEALKSLGQTPVIQPDNTSEYMTAHTNST